MNPHWSANQSRQLVVSSPSPRMSHSRARLRKTACVSGCVSPITQGVCCLMIPAFSAAISASVLPKNSVWSIPILVMTESNGVRILVLSNRPPKPTSMTAISTFCSAKYQKASAMVVSKNEGRISSKNARLSATKRTTSSSGIISPDMRIRSRKSTKWGEVNNPTLYPCACNAAAMRWDVDPLPLVPAIWTARRCVCGLPRCAMRR